MVKKVHDSNQFSNNFKNNQNHIQQYYLSLFNYFKYYKIEFH